MKQVLKIAMHEAGKLLLANFGKITDYEVKESQSSIVTKTDFESEKLIMKIISENYPGHNLLGEETGFKNQNSVYTWIVDPIDGTSNFAAGIPWFGVLICLLKDFEPVLSGCYLPVQNHMYLAVKGEGATLNDESIFVSAESELKNILIAYSLDFSNQEGKTESEAKLIECLVKNVRNLRSTNCLVDFCLTAEGKLGACANQTTGIWDVAAPSLLIEEAGGVMTDFNGNALNFAVTEKDYLRNFEVVASNKILHPQLLKLLKVNRI